MVLVIFDLDGTLIYSEGRRDSRCFAAAYEEVYGQPFPSIDWRNYPHVTDTTIFGSVIEQHFGRSVEPGEEDAFRENYLGRLQEVRRVHPQYFREVPGARACLHYLLEKGNYHLEVATGGWKAPAELKLRHLDFPLGAGQISGADGKVRREEILQEAIDRANETGNDFDRIVYIGDAIWDVTTTRNMELNFLGIRYRNDREVLQKEGAFHVLENFLDKEAFRLNLYEARPPA